MSREDEPYPESSYVTTVNDPKSNQPVHLSYGGPRVHGPLRITIEGPQGSGKTFVAEAFAEILRTVGGVEDVTIVDGYEFDCDSGFEPAMPTQGVVIVTTNHIL